ncbi:MAG: acyltransferase [Rhizomicrobium sp.]
MEILNGKTIDEQLTLTNSRSSGFDYLRIVLSVSVIAYHSFEVCYGPGIFKSVGVSPFRFLVGFILPSFFCLSGFLVAGSMLRVKDLLSFYALRGMRIFPALAVEVLLSALIIGPLLTVIPVGQYFSSPMFFFYFLNVLGDIHFYLPGLFVTNPMPAVNAQLWTIPYELECYVLIGLAAFFGLLKRRRAFVWAVIGLTVATYSWRILRHGLPTNFTIATGQALAIAFLVGVAFYLYRDKVRLNPILFAASVAIYCILLPFPAAALLLPFPAGYMTVYLGLTNPPKIGLLKSGDYSYGLYLYGYPVQQVVSQLLPQYRFWYVNLALSLLIAGAVAYCSWTFVESKILGHKKLIIARLEGMRAALIGFVRPAFRRMGIAERPRLAVAPAAVSPDADASVANETRG